MKTFAELLKDALPGVEEIFPWDLEEQMREDGDILVLDIREPYEFNVMHIEDSVNVPRGVLESAAEWDYEETEPDLVQARDRHLVVVCRSGSRPFAVAGVQAWNLLYSQSLLCWSARTRSASTGRSSARRPK